MPPASAILRMVGFAVTAALTMAGIQPMLGALMGAVGVRWAIGLTLPALVTAGVIFGLNRRWDRGEAQPPWYSAWVLLPGAFLLAGAAAMCIFGALVEFSVIGWAMWALLVTGALLWVAAMAVVRSASH